MPEIDRGRVVAITFDGRLIEATAGSSLLEALSAGGILLRSDCGGGGRCGRCRLHAAPGDAESLSPATPAEREHLGEARLLQGERLACQTMVYGPTGVRIPAASLRPPALAPEPAPPSLVVAPPLAPSAAGRGTRPAFGAAIDLGTTTIAVYLCDLRQGRVVASSAVPNPQSLFGSDVISRIAAARQASSILVRLQRLAVGAIAAALECLCRELGTQPQRIVRLTAVGNSAMLHLLLGEDPAPMGVHPYRPRFTAARCLPGCRIGLPLSPRAALRTLPLIGGFLGADIVAAAMAVGLDARPPGTLLVDVGTNGEIMLATGNGFLAASCATGPALEGAAIRHGVPAGAGAIHAVRHDPATGRLRWRLIPGTGGAAQKASGLCGSGVVGALAALLRMGAVNLDGRFNAALPSPCWRRGQEGILEFEIASAAASRDASPITLTQTDIRAIQLAKGALRAGIDLLCRATGTAKPTAILLAGAFGSRIDRRDALRIGMLPSLPLSRISAVGNAAGAGAVMALVERGSLTRAAAIARRTRMLDLAAQPDFQAAFIAALPFGPTLRIR
jgi:uncharacterized 2Fe-2S/4Fe-4S cluster protein (DUF4445 family)